MVLGSNYSVKQSVPALVTMLIAIVVAVISTNTFAGDGNRCSSAEKMKARWTTADGTCTKRGMLLFYSPGADMKGHFVKASLGTLEEIDVNGRVIKKVKLGHRRPNIINDYVFSTEVWQINYSLTPELMAKQKTRFGREGFQARFNRTMHFGTLTSSITESAECPLCASGTSGSCQNAATKACASPNTATDRCPRRFSPCTTTFLVYPNVLSVSYEVEDWPFSSPDNTLRYSMVVHAKKDSKVYPSDENYDENFDLANIFDFRTLAVVRANNGDKRLIDINASLVEKRNKRMIFSVETPAFAPGETLFYN